MFASRRRTLFFSLGGAAFLAGIALLSLGVYSALNSDNGPPTSDAPVVRVSDILTPTPTPAIATTTPIPTPKPLPPFGDEAYSMVIDKIGVDAPVETFGLDDQQVPVIPTGADAAQVVAWYNFSARPGTGSNAVFAGHVTWYGPAVFYSLADLSLGDEIRLKGADGTELSYKVSNIFQVLSTDPHARDVMFGTSQDILTIITCDGVFTKDPNDHVTGGNYDQRLVVRADLESVTHPTSTPGSG